MALAQALLAELGIELVADGHFGTATERAVTEYQEAVGLERTGEVDPPKWELLRQNHPIRVVDVVDATDITVFKEGYPYLHDGHSEVELSYGASRGTRALLERLVRNNAPRSVAQLRFHGRGAPGSMGVSRGDLGQGGSIAYNHFTNPAAQAAYAQLGTIMKPHGSIELHGSNVALRRNGRRLLDALATSTRVPVSAAVRVQYGASDSSRMEGSVRTSCPGGRSLGHWAVGAFALSGW